MTKFALYVPLQAKPGKENEVADFLRSAVPLVNADPARFHGLPFKRGRPALRYSTRLTTSPDARRISTVRWQQR